MATFSIGLTKDFDESQIAVKDITTYPQTVNTVSMTQEKISRIMLYSTDAFVADFNSNFANPGSAVLDAEWIFPTDNDTVYSVSMYTGIDWDAVTVDCDSWAIAFYDGDFWINKSVNTKDTGTDPTPRDDNDWARLYVGAAIDFTALGGSNYAAITEAQMRDILETSRSTSSVTEADDGLAQTEGDPFTIAKTDCHEWTITSNLAVDIPMTIELLDVDYSSVDDSLTFSGSEALIDLDDYDSGGDGAYLVKIVYTVSAIENTIYLPIYEFCDAEDCYMQLFQYILCHCSDPCDDCDDDYATRKYDLDMIGHALFQIKQYVYLDKYQYMGIMNINDTRQDLIDTISLMIDKLSIIVDRCGLCDDDDDNEV